jgi:hypothetical protein
MPEAFDLSLPAQNMAPGELSDLARNLRSNVVWSAVFDLVGTIPNVINPSDLLPHIEARLNASLEDVVEALSGLTKLGLIQPGAAGYSKLREHYELPDLLNGETIRLGTDRALQVMNIMTAEHPHYIKNYSLRLNPYQLYEMVEELDQVLQKYMNQKEKPMDPTDGVYEVFVGGARVTRNRIKGGLS